MNLDLDTTAFLIIVGNMLMGGGLLAVSRGVFGRMREVSAWAIATLLQGLGWIISIALKNFLPDVFAKAVGNGLIMLCLAMYLVILADFCGKPVRAKWLYWLVVAQSLLLAYFTGPDPNTAARIVVISACAGAILLKTGHVLLTGSNRRLPSHLFTAGLFALCGTATVTRGIYYVMEIFAPGTLTFNPVAIGNITFLTIYVMSVMVTFGFLLMCDERDVAARELAQSELSQLNATLEQRIARRTEELKNANKDMESFNYSISHDLKAPLRSILVHTGLLIDRHGASLTDDARQFLSRLERSAKRMNALIDDLLAFARITKVGLEHKRLVDMQMLAEDVIDELGVQQVVTLGALPAVMGDPSMLRQVWANLIANGVKFSRPVAKPEIRISGATLPDGSVEYLVADNGVGFDMAHADRLFSVFQRLHSQREFEGTGVGLAIVERILTRHGGKISAESAPERGARFRFVLPSGNSQDPV